MVVWPEMLYLSPLPILSALLFLWLWRPDLPPASRRPPCDPAVPDARRHLRLALPGWRGRSTPSWCPTTTIWQALSDRKLAIILAGTVVVLRSSSSIVYALRVFGGGDGFDV